MNHTNSTLVIVAIAASMVVAATTLALGSISEHLAYAKSKHSPKVKVGNTKNKCVTNADNSQHIAFGAGAIGNTASNIATNIQTQTCNVGSTGAG
jgi:CBS domain containing-hemolysin-like protein